MGSKPSSPAGWSAAFTARAQAYWTPQRTRELVGDKPLLLLPTEAAPLLRLLGLLQRDASMPPDKVRKYRQINHLLLLLEPPLKDLMTGPPLTILDAACGGSYLTLLLAWAFRHRWRYPATVIGIDQNSALLKKCAKHAALLGLDVRYQAARITDFAGPRADALVALHACDTASDDALALGVRMGAALIAVVPCCQAELAAQCESGPLASVWASPHLGRLVGSTLTDALRMLLLRAHGYDATAMEFVPTEHTPKNTLIRARKRRESDAGAEREYQQLKAALGGACIHLERMLGLSLPSAS